MRGLSRRRGYCVTTERDIRHRPAPDLVNRMFVATGINQLWMAEMTYIPTCAGFLYLSVVINVYSRKVVAWAFGERMTADLVILALNIALMTRKPQSVIHHSDQGSQYTSIAFGKRCKQHPITSRRDIKKEIPKPKNRPSTSFHQEAQTVRGNGSSPTSPQI
jgi:putative transposase